MDRIIHSLPRSGRFLTRIAAALLVFSGAVGARQPDIPWSTDIEASLHRASAEGRPVLMEFTADWCTHCQRMEKNTFTDPQVAARINRNFVAIRIDADAHKPIVRELGIKGLPAMLVVAPDMEILERITGYQTPESLLTRLDNALAQTSVAATPAASGITRPAAMEREPTSPESEPDFTSGSRTDAAADSGFATLDSPPPAAQPTPAAQPQNQESGRVSLGDTRADLPALPATQPADDAWADFGTDIADSARSSSDHEADTAPFEADSDLPAWADRSAGEPESPVASGGAAAEAAANDAFTEFVPEDAGIPEFPALGSGDSGSARPSETPEPSADTQTSASSSGLRTAFAGQCPVTAIDERRIVPGERTCRVICRGREVWFCSDAARARFESDPTKYWPMFDGLCPLTLAEQGEAVEGDLRYAVLFRKRIWLLRDQAAVQAFVDRPGETIQTALIHYQSLMSAADSTTTR